MDYSAAASAVDTAAAVQESASDAASLQFPADISLFPGLNQSCYLPRMIVVQDRNRLYLPGNLTDFVFLVLQELILFPGDPYSVKEYSHNYNSWNR